MKNKIVLFVILIFFVNVIQLIAGVPTINSVTTVDSNNNGHIDGLHIVFNEAVDINDPNGGVDGFDCLNVTGYTIANSDYDSTDVTTMDLILQENAGYDTGAKPDITYHQGQTSSIVSVSTSEPMADAYNFNSTTDGAFPIVTDILGTNGYYNAGENIDITVEYSENVYVTGSPILTLQLNGAVTRDANYNSGSGNNQLVFRYTVQSGDNSSDLDYINSNALNLNGGAIRDAANNDAINTLPNPGSSGSLSANSNIVVDTVQPTMLSATFHDPDHNDIDEGDYISIGFNEPVKINCTNSSDFILLNSSYGDTFGNGSYLSNMSPGNNYIEIVLGTNPHLILPGIWSSPGDKMPSGIGITSGGTSCVVDLADNTGTDSPQVDVGGSGSNNIATILATDGADVFSNPGSSSTFVYNDISVSITLDYNALYVALWYDIGKDPDGIATQNNNDVRLLATGSGKNWNVVIPSSDTNIKEGVEVRFILDVDGAIYYSNGSDSSGGSIPWSFTIVYEQKDRVSIRNNIINPKNGDLTYLNYFLNASKKVSISVYDIAGDRVKLLKNKNEASGVHLVTWNGKNQKGQNCIPGLYYVLINIGKKRYIKKVLILK